MGVGGEVTDMGVDSLNGKQDVSPLRAPALPQSPGINWSWGFFGGGDSGFFSFPSAFLSYLRASDEQTWKQLLICIELGRQGELRTHRAAFLVKAGSQL